MKTTQGIRKLMITALVGGALALPGMQFAGTGVTHAGPIGIAPVIIGDWHNTNPRTQNLTRVIITRNAGGAFTMHAYGSCAPTDCDQGLTTATGSTSSAVATYHFSFAVKTESISIQGPYLEVGTSTHFIDGSGRADYSSLDFMYRYGSSGSWYNRAPSAGSFTRIDLFTNGTQLMARVYKACVTGNCVVITAPVTRSYPGYVSYNAGFAIITLMMAGPGPTMQTDTITHLTDGSGHETHQYATFSLSV